MPNEKLSLLHDPSAARLAIAWEIVRASAIDKSNPHGVAKILGEVVQILEKAQTPEPKLSGDITVHALSPKDGYASPGSTLRCTYRFSGGPTSIPLVVFVHFFADGGDGSPVWGDDHDPPTRTTAWSGETSYSRDIVIPNNAPAGTYRIGVGLYDAEGAGERLSLKTASGAASGGGKRYEVGTLKVG